MKVCKDCKEDKELKYFSEDKKRNRHFSICKKCMAKRTEAYRQLHKDKWRESSKKHSIKFNILIKKWKSQGCVKCGDKRYYVLDAHHLDPSKKDFSIGNGCERYKNYN
jgi:protein-arginine kinase activator protein McsA